MFEFDLLEGWKPLQQIDIKPAYGQGGKKVFPKREESSFLPNREEQFVTVISLKSDLGELKDCWEFFQQGVHEIPGDFAVSREVYRARIGEPWELVKEESLTGFDDPLRANPMPGALPINVRVAGLWADLGWLQNGDLLFSRPISALKTAGRPSQGSVDLTVPLNTGKSFRLPEPTGGENPPAWLDCRKAIEKWLRPSDGPVDIYLEEGDVPVITLQWV
jgi:hypothetical protein